MYKYNDEFCKYLHVGKNGIIDQSYLTYKNKINSIFDLLSTTHINTNNYKVIHKQDLSESVKQCLPIAKIIEENFSHYVFIGMGGAILNPMMMLSLPRITTTKKIHYLNTTDPDKFVKLINELDLKKTAFIIFSSTGQTCETISLVGAFVNEFNKNNLNFSENFFFCVGSSQNLLRRFAIESNAMIIDFDTQVAGRFSSFSNSVVLTGLLGGKDLQSFEHGANKVVKDFWANKSYSQPIKGALSIFFSKQPILINISYNHYFKIYLEWYCQIIAESMGKNKMGYTPIYGLGPQEQHSMMQLYLDGPQDKLYTFFNVKSVYEQSVADSIFNDHYLKSQSLEDINSALYKGTCQSIKEKDLPLRTIEFDKFDEEELGALVMHSTIETIFLCLLNELNPFDQPGVEAIKTKVREILKL